MYNLGSDAVAKKSLLGIFGRKPVFVVIAIFLTASSLDAEIIPQIRRADWTQAGVRGGIPKVSTIYTTLSPGATLAQLNSAIRACPSNQVVKLSPGQYTFAGPIDFGQKKGVVLRGAG